MDILKKMLEERNTQAIADKQAKLKDAAQFAADTYNQNYQDLYDNDRDSGDFTMSNSARDNIQNLINNSMSKYRDLGDLKELNADVGLLPKVRQPITDNTQLYNGLSAKDFNREFQDSDDNRVDSGLSDSIQNRNNLYHLELLKNKLGIK